MFGVVCTTERFSFYSGSEIRDFVNSHPEMESKIKIPDDTSVCPLKDRSYSPCSGSARFDDITTLKICEFKGYTKVISKTSSFYNSPADNTLWNWDTTKNNGVVQWADVAGNQILDVLTCEREVCPKQCSDGIDNDGDGKIDYPTDEGCVDANDDNEAGEPIGNFDGVNNCQNVYGWTCDSDDFNKAIDVHLYKNGPVGAGGVLLGIFKADMQRGSQVGALCDGNNNHGFSFALPADLKDGTSKKIYAYSINIGTPSNNVHLTGSPAVFTCNPPKCSEDQTIFETLTVTKSNAALYNDPNFDNRICYDKIFGNNYPETNPPHICIANDKNTVLWLKTNSDSKVSTTKSSDFATPVCYGDLKCRAVDESQGQLCNSDEKIVASLESTTNSLVSEGDDTDYKIKICCKSQVALNTVNWADMENNQITTANIKDTVQMIVGGVYLKDESLRFTIKKKETLGGIDRLAKDKVIISTESNKLIEQWIAGEITLNTGVELWIGEYYFEVILNEDTATKKTSGILIVTAPENNQPPVANIVSPGDGNIFFLNGPITFTQDSYDLDDNFEYTWDFGDGIILSGNSITKENYNPVHTYTTVGQKLIKLKVKDNRELEVTDQVSILVVDSGKYAFASISVPKNERDEPYGISIDYDATKTYAIDVIKDSNGCRTISCYAGLCPTVTTGISSCPSNTGPISISPLSSSNDIYQLLNFKWEHCKKTDGVFGNCVQDNRQGSNGVLFSKSFINVGDYSSKLTISLGAPSPDSFDKSIFKVAYDRYTCEKSDSYSRWISSDLPIIDSSNNCEINDPLIQGETCCPTNGYNCVQDKCARSITKCSDFESESDCNANGGNQVLAESQFKNNLDISSESNCINIEEALSHGNNGKCTSSCFYKCEWKTNKCVLSSENKIVYGGPPSISWLHSDLSSSSSLLSNYKNYCEATTQDVTYKCTYDIESKGDCNGAADFYEELWTAVLSAQNGDGTPIDCKSYDAQTNPKIDDACKSCVSGSHVVNCEKVIKLPFFDYRNFILSVLILVTIYYFIVKKEKK